MGYERDERDKEEPDTEVRDTEERGTEEDVQGESISPALDEQAVGYAESPAEDDSDAPISLEDADTQPGFTPGGDVRAENVTISQGGAQNVDATTVSITQGGAARVQAGELSVSQGGVAIAQTEQLMIQEGGSAFAVIADSATVADGGSVFMLLTRSVTGDVRPVLDWRAALAFGAAFAVVLRILRRR